MGLKPIEVNRLTLYEFAMMELGHFYRKSEELDRLRTLQSTIMTFAGMRAGKLINPQDVMGIPIIDNEDVALPISSREQAIKMIDLYMQGLEWQN